MRSTVPGDLKRQAALRAVWGGLEVAVPRRLLGLLRQQPDDAVELAVRVLGARHLAEATAMTLAPRRPIYLAAAGVDALHALSMVALARARPAQATLCLTSAAVATAFAASAVRSGRRA